MPREGDTHVYRALQKRLHESKLYYRSGIVGTIHPRKRNLITRNVRRLSATETYKHHYNGKHRLSGHSQRENKRPEDRVSKTNTISIKPPKQTFYVHLPAEIKFTKNEKQKRNE